MGRGHWQKSLVTVTSLDAKAYSIDKGMMPWQYGLENGVVVVYDGLGRVAKHRREDRLRDA